MPASSSTYLASSDISSASSGFTSASSNMIFASSATSLQAPNASTTPFLPFSILKEQQLSGNAADYCAQRLRRFASVSPVPEPAEGPDFTKPIQPPAFFRSDSTAPRSLSTQSVYSRPPTRKGGGRLKISLFNSFQVGLSAR